MEALRQLISLQALDNDIRKLEATKEQLQEKSRTADQAVRQSHAALERSAEAALAARKEADKRDGDLKVYEEKISRLSTQLNTVKTNKEYSAIQHEILNAKQEMGKVEDEILRLMEDIEARQKESAELEDTASQADAELTRQRKILEEALADADARIGRLQDERDALAKTIPSKHYNAYERLRKGKRGRALAACRNFVCQGCRMALTANTVNLLMAGTDLVMCHSCGRILYIPADEDHLSGAGAGRS
jgi:hypothetical protein